MNLCISRSAALSLTKLALTSRIVYGILIDMPQLYNAGWISVLLGGALALPFWFSIAHLSKISEVRSSPLFRILLGSFFLIAVYDAGILATSIAESASYMALNSTAPIYLMLPLLLLCLCCLRFNGNALGSSAGIWNRVLPCFLLLIIILQSGDYESDWLTPVFGPGIREISKGALKAAGWFLQPAALLLIADEDKFNPTHTSLPKALGIIIAVSALICISFSMMMPAIPEEKLFVRSFRLETLLANGRSGLSMQFPTIAVWYLGLFYALLFDVFTGSIMLQLVLPELNRYICITASLVSSALLAVSKLSDRTPALAASGLLFPIEAALILCILIRSMKGEHRHA